MSPTTRASVAAAVLVAATAASQVCPATALADPAQPAPTPTIHNVTYRARVDGVARGALVSYKINDNNINSDYPTMLPGQMFEANAVLADPNKAGMAVSIRWPYSASLHCEILVDDGLVAQADQFIAPRVLPVKDDPLYGTIQCGAPLPGITDLTSTAPSATT
jgi:hypothetical protein